MLIDYSRMDINLNKYFNYGHDNCKNDKIRFHGNRLIRKPLEKKGSDVCHTILVPCTEKEQKKITRVNRLFGTKDVETVEKVIDKKGFGIASSGFMQGDVCFFYNEEGQKVFLRIDENTLAPKLRYQPSDVQEIIDIVKLDPRLLSQIDPTGLNLQSIENITSAAAQAYANIMMYQSQYGVEMSEEELKEREEYKNVCQETLNMFMKRWRKIQSLYLDTSDNMEL